MEPTLQNVVDALMEQLRTNTVLRRAAHIADGPDQIEDEPATIAFATAEGDSVFLKVELA